jgi:hypothetical protein
LKKNKYIEIGNRAYGIDEEIDPVFLLSSPLGNGVLEPFFALEGLSLEEFGGISDILSMQFPDYSFEYCSNIGGVVFSRKKKKGGISNEKQ